MEIETHPFEDFVPDNATHLILGTFPTRKPNWQFNAYYPGRSNFFWRLLSEIYGQPFQHKEGEAAALERITLVRAKGIALSDTVYSCRRKIATSSKDSDLEIVEKMDVVKILKKHPSIHTVITTGSSGPVSAHKLFYQHLDEKKVKYEIEPSAKPPIHGKVFLGNRIIEVHSLYSTSGLNIGRYPLALEQYREHLPK